MRKLLFIALLIAPIFSLGAEALFNALDKGNLPEFKKLIAGGADANSEAYQGRGPILMVAAAMGKTNFVKVLVEAGADVNAVYDGVTALVVSYKSPEIVRYLLENKADPNFIADIKVAGWIEKFKIPTLDFMAAYASCDGAGADIIKDLLVYGAKASEGYPLHLVNCARPRNIYPEIRSYFQGVDTVYFAYDHEESSFEVYKQVTEQLLAAGIKVNAKNESGETALFRIVSHRSPYSDEQALERMEFLIQKGADITMMTDYGYSLLTAATENDDRLGVIKFLLGTGKFNVNHVSPDGKSPLIFASYGEGSEEMKLLLKHGAKVDIREKGGVTPLMNAAKVDNANNVRLLLKYGASVNAKDRKGNTALIAGAESASPVVALMLLKKGALKNIINRDGETALGVAVRSGNHQYAEVIRNF